MMLSREDEQKAVDIIKKDPRRFRDIPVQTERICCMAVRRDPDLLRYVKEQTEKIRREAVRKDGNALRFCDDQSDEVCALAVSQNPEAIRYAKNQIRPLCDLAIERSRGSALAHVRDPDAEMCGKAVGLYSGNIRFVPLRLQTDEMREWAVRSEPENIRAVEQTPELCGIAISGAIKKQGHWVPEIIAACEHQDKELCKKALSGYRIADILKAIREQTPEIRKAALENAESCHIPEVLAAIRNLDDSDCGLALDRFREDKEKIRKSDPDSYRTGEMRKSLLDRLMKALDAMGSPSAALCGKAVSLNGLCLSAIRNPDKELCRIAVADDGMALRYVPEKLKSREMILDAVSRDGLALQFAGRQDEGIVMAAVRQNGHALEHADLQTKDICIAACAQKGSALRHVWKQDGDICLAAVRQDGMAIVHVIDKTPEVARAAVERDGAALEYVPKNMVTSEIARIAVESSPEAFRHVPKELRGAELSRMAVELDPELITSVPRDVLTEEMCRIALKSPAAMRRLTESMSDRGLEGYPSFVPELVREAVRSDWTMLANAHWRAHDRKLYEAALLNADGSVNRERLEFLKKTRRAIRDDVLAEVLENAGKPTAKPAPKP